MEESKEVFGHEEISGWLLRTAGKNLASAKEEAWNQKFFRLNFATGLLCEYQDENKDHKLQEFVLWRKISWVETNLQNKLRPEHEKVFRQIIGRKAPFKMPS